MRVLAASSLLATSTDLQICSLPTSKKDSWNEEYKRI